MLPSTVSVSNRLAVELRRSTPPRLPTSDQERLSLRVKYVPSATLMNWSLVSSKEGASVNTGPIAGMAMVEFGVALLTLLS